VLIVLQRRPILPCLCDSVGRSAYDRPELKGSPPVGYYRFPVDLRYVCLSSVESLVCTSPSIDKKRLELDDCRRKNAVILVCAAEASHASTTVRGANCLDPASPVYSYLWRWSLLEPMSLASHTVTGHWPDLSPPASHRRRRLNPHIQRVPVLFCPFLAFGGTDVLCCVPRLDIGPGSASKPPHGLPA